MVLYHTTHGLRRRGRADWGRTSEVKESRGVRACQVDLAKVVDALDAPVANQCVQPRAPSHGATCVRLCVRSSNQNVQTRSFCIYSIDVRYRSVFKPLELARYQHTWYSVRYHKNPQTWTVGKLRDW